jgi:phenylalanyl-tRNA synthetase beta chain
VYGIAREASAILPRFGIPAKLKPVRSESKRYFFTKKVDYLTAKVDKNLCPRFTTALVKNVKIGDSPKIIKDRLESANIRPINNVVDISNYIMLELGQPVHTFDYDKIKNAEMVLRESKKGEKIVTLDEKEFILPGGDIVIEDGEGRLIDLAGIMGGHLSAVDDNTKNVLLFVQTYNPINIRKTSMALSQRTQAAAIFEKGTDEELVAPAILSAIEMFKSITHCDVSENILDLYPKSYKTTTIKTSLEYITTRLGVEIDKKNIASYLRSLEFECFWSGNTLTVAVPSFRSKDIKAEEDVLEEIARIYGYHNLQSKIMPGDIPERPEDQKFAFERQIRNIISGFGGTEIFTLALVSRNQVEEKNIKLKNPLGPDTEYMRTSLMPSLTKAAKENAGTVDKFHLFEIANIYIPRVNDLPEERMTLGGIFCGYEYRKAKGVLEGLLDRSSIKYLFKSEESKGFDASRCAFVYSKGEVIGKIGYVENSNLIYYEFQVSKLIKAAPKVISFKTISKYPAQIEDITFSIPEKTKIGDIVNFILQIHRCICNVELKDVFEKAYTFRIWYQDSEKTLTDEDVEKIRKEITSGVKSKFGASIKE